MLKCNIRTTNGLAPNTQRITFNKSEAEYNMKSIRFLLLTISSMFIIISCLMIVLGLSVYSHYHEFSFLNESSKSSMIFTPSILVVLLGMALFVVSLFGFFGSLKRSTMLVNLYAVVLTVILILKLVVIIISFTTKHSIADYINIPVKDYVNDVEIEYEIDSLQVSLNCCGSKSYLDYVGLDFTNQSTVYVTNEVDGRTVMTKVPETCCITPGEAGVCGKMRTLGCKSALFNVVVQNASVLGVLGVSVMFIQLLGIIFALLLARCIRRVKSEKAMLVWKMKEQMIIARQEMNKDSIGVYIKQAESSRA